MKICCTIIISIVLSFNVFSQPQWKIFNITNSPFPASYLNSARSDGIGNIWIGTMDGLYKYDGIFWNHYDTSNSEIPNNHISGFAIDRLNNLWFQVDVLPYPYFVKFDGAVWEQIDTNQNCYTYSYYFAIDGYETKWSRESISSYEAIIRRYDGFSCIEYDEQDIGISCVTIRTMQVDVNDNLWFISEEGGFGINGGIARTSQNGWIYKLWNGIPFQGLAIDVTNNKAWTTDVLGSLLLKLNYSDLQIDTAYSFYNPGISGFRYGTHIIIDLNGNLWQNGIIATSPGEHYMGLVCFKVSAEEWVVYDENNSPLPANKINGLAIDIHNNKWINTDNGLAAFNETGLILPTQLTTNDTLIFGDVLINDILTKHLIIYNSTNETLNVDSIHINLPEFSSMVSLPVSISEGDSLSITVEFHPELKEEYTGKLTLFTNKGLYIQVITGNGVLTLDNDNLIEISMDFNLGQNYPNPFNPSTKIKFTIPSVGAYRNTPVHLKVYDVLGNEVATLVNEEKPPGNYEVEFKAERLTSGIYFYRLIVGTFSQTRKMVFLR